MLFRSIEGHRQPHVGVRMPPVRMMPEIEIVPILKDGKRHASVTIMYSNGGWKAHAMYYNRSEKVTAHKLGEGADLLGAEAARQIALDLASKWRDEEVKAGRF